MQPIPESTYYGRHFRLPGFNGQTQGRLRAARVLVVGMGGLGCPAALYLAGMGVGTLTLCDADTVSATNLHRQVLFEAQHVGLKKVDVAAARLRAGNPHIVVNTVDAFATPEMLAELVTGHDVVLDGTDNFTAKFAINDACEAAGVPLVYGSIFQFEGQVSVFHLPGENGRAGFSYRDLYPDSPPASLAQNCGEAGVVGVLPGVIGTLQATEVFKVLTGLGEPLSGALLTYDALTATTRRLALLRRRRRENAGSDVRLMDYADYLQRLARGEHLALLDVREAEERELSSLGGVHVPLGQLHLRMTELPTGLDIVVYCKSGVRSARAALYVASQRPDVRVYSLTGGCDAALQGRPVCA